MPRSPFRNPVFTPLAFAFLLACESISIGTRPPAEGPSGAPTASPAAAEIPIGAELVAKRLDAATYVVTHKAFYDSNVLVAAMPENTVLLASSPYETEGARALLRWVRTTFKPTRIVAINTHVHFDGTGGNEAYLEDHVEVHASALTTSLLVTKGETMRRDTRNLLGDQNKRDRLDKMRIVPADHTFPEAAGLTLTFGNEKVEVHYPGPAHSPDNVVVYLRHRHILFGGCMVKAGNSIGFVGDADLGHWEAAIRSVQRFAEGATTVVPGHGEPSGPDLLENTIRIVRANRDLPKVP